MDLTQLYADNDFFQGGLVLAAIAAVWAGLVRYGKTFFYWLLHRFAITITVDNQNLLFDALSTWLDEEKALDKVRRLRYESHRAGDFLASPSDGTHFIRLMGRWVMFYRETAEKQTVWGKPHETFQLTIPFITRAGLDRWVSEVLAAHDRRAERVPMVWNWQRGHWRRLRRVPQRPLHTVSLAGSKLSNLLADIQTFLSDREGYQTRGIPWRRGYLFSGAPGTGKSTTAIALANETQMSVAYLSLAASGLDDSALISAITDLPNHTILLLEDIDAVIPSREVKKVKKVRTPQDEDTPISSETEAGAGVTMSGLLNALDGIVTPEGLIVIMTTNYPDRLDAALLRPGRADYPVVFDLADADQAKEIVFRITEDPDMAQAVVVDLDEHGPIAHAFIQQAAIGAKCPVEIGEILYKARFEKPGSNTLSDETMV